MGGEIRRGLVDQRLEALEIQSRRWIADVSVVGVRERWGCSARAITIVDDSGSFNRRDGSVDEGDQAIQDPRDSYHRLEHQRGGFGG